MAILSFFNLIVYVGLGILGSILFFTDYLHENHDREIAFFIIVSLGFVMSLIVLIFQCSKYQKDKYKYLPLTTTSTN